jgi:hypothetical protein
MPKRKVKYEDKPHVMRPELRKRFEALMAPEYEEPDKSQPAHWKHPHWELWRWDTLEDVPQYLTK